MLPEVLAAASVLGAAAVASVYAETRFWTLIGVHDLLFGLVPVILGAVLISAHSASVLFLVSISLFGLLSLVSFLPVSWYPVEEAMFLPLLGLVVSGTDRSGPVPFYFFILSLFYYVVSRPFLVRGDIPKTRSGIKGSSLPEQQGLLGA